MSISDYAGFWLRLVAFIIDSIVLSVIYLLLVIPLYDAFWPRPPFQMNEIAFQGEVVVSTPTDAVFPTADFSQVIILLIGLVYYSVMESSRYQASLGKLALELKVAGTQGNRLSFSRSLLRNVSKAVSLMPLCMGFVAVAFTPKRQALHDIIAGTIVLKM